MTIAPSQLPSLEVLQAEMKRKRRRLRWELFLSLATVAATLALNRRAGAPAWLVGPIFFAAWMFFFVQWNIRYDEIKALKQQISDAEDALLFEEPRISPGPQRDAHAMTRLPWGLGLGFAGAAAGAIAYLIINAF